MEKGSFGGNVLAKQNITCLKITYLNYRSIVVKDQVVG